MPNARPIVEPKRGPDGLILEPDDSDPATLIEENHNRLRFAKKANYADGYVGDGNTYDAAGRYNCGACNQADGAACLFWDIDNLDLEAGSCRSWEVICAGDPEMRLQLPDEGAASYGVAANGVGFGCARCPWSSKSKRGPDSLGRTLWCGEGGFRVFETACCEFNGAELVAEGDTRARLGQVRRGAFAALRGR